MDGARRLRACSLALTLAGLTAAWVCPARAGAAGTPPCRASTPLGGATPLTPDEGASLNVLRLQVKLVVAELGFSFSRRLHKPVSIRICDRPLTKNGRPLPARTYPARRVKGRLREVTTGPMQTCRIDIFPIGLPQPFGALDEAQSSGNLAHEITHCLQLELMGTTRWIAGTRDPQFRWLQEGAAEWVGYEYAGMRWDDFPNNTPPPSGPWGRYITEPQMALFDRGYDGVGFFAHIARNPHVTVERAKSNAHRAIVSMIKQSLKGRHRGARNAAAFRVAHESWGRRRGAKTEFLRVWATSYVRRGMSFGSVWDMVGTGLPANLAPTPIFVRADATYRSPRAGVRLFKLEAADGLVVSVSGKGFGGLHWEHPSQQFTNFFGTIDKSYCIRSCACPSGGTLSPSVQTVAANRAWVAVTPGAAHANTVRFTFGSPAAHCQGGSAGSAQIDACSLYSSREATRLIRALINGRHPVEKFRQILSPGPVCAWMDTFGDSVWVDQRTDFSVLENPQFEQVFGVGDGAAVLDKSERLTFVVGPLLLSVQIVVGSGNTRRATISLAQEVAGNARGVCC